MIERKDGLIQRTNKIYYLLWQVHSFVAAVARTSYFFQLDIVPLDLGFGGIIALAIAGYTALVAMIVAKESEQDKIAAWIWLGVMIPNILRWLFPIDASGVYYVAVIALNRTSLWAGIPGAWQSRDGRWFTDTTMLVFNLVCSFLWITYGIVINNVYLALNSMFAVIFIVPCLILKVRFRQREKNEWLNSTRFHTCFRFHIEYRLYYYLDFAAKLRMKTLRIKAHPKTLLRSPLKLMEKL